MFFGLLLAATITITNSTNVETHTSTTASGGNAVVEVRTNVNGQEWHERRETQNGSVELTVVATSSGSSVYATSSAGVNASSSAVNGTTTARVAVEKVLDLVRKILALFGLSVKDL